MFEPGKSLDFKPTSHYFRLKVMLKKAAIVILSVISAPVFADDGVKWYSSLDTAMAAAREQNRPILLDIYATWCGYCRRLRTEVYPSREFLTETRNFILVSVDGERTPGVASKYHIDGFPTILFLDRNGTALDRVNGFVDARSLTRKMRDVVLRSGREGVLRRDLETNPNGVMPNYSAGVYYYEAGQISKAREYFLSAWRSTETGFPEKKLNSIFNAAVSSMDLDDHESAVRQWTEYINASTHRDSDYAYARYYRGLSLRVLGRTRDGLEDFRYASQNLPEERDRRSARIIFDSIH